MTKKILVHLLPTTMGYTEVHGRERPTAMVTFLLRELGSLSQLINGSFQPRYYVGPVIAYRPAYKDCNNAALIIDDGQRCTYWQPSISVESHTLEGGIHTIHPTG